MTDWEEGTVYLRTTDEKGFVSHTEHRAWHVTRFIQKQHAAAAKIGAKVEQITEQDYRKATGKLLRKSKS